MSSAEKIRKLFAKSDITVNSRVDDRIINDALTALDKPENTQSVSPESNIWRIIMKSSITKLTAAAATIIAVVFSISLLDKVATQAYALEQTIEANHTIKTVHMRIFEGAESIENNEFSDYWIKYNDAGKLSNLRRNEHDKDSVRFTVWNEGVKKTWIPENNVVIVNRLNNTAKELEDFAETFDPKLFLQRLYDESKEKEEIEIKIDEPAEDSDSIYVKATHSVHKFRMELVVDRKTKLIKKLSRYRLREHGDELNAQVEYLAYNQPIDPSMFELSGIPDNAKVIDRVEGGIIIPGLRVGDYTLGMSKDEVLNKLGEPGGMSFVMDDGVVKEISVRSSLYKFTNGLGVGNSEQKIKQAFGEDFQLEEFELKALLTYEDKGLQFEIHKQDRTVMEINVSPRPGSEAYKKADIPPTSYINEQGHIVDKVDYPFINDPQVIGTWKSVDFVREINQFNPAEKSWRGDLYLKELIFLPNGKTFKPWWTWTKGLVFHSGSKTASKYTLKDIEGSTYMFFEWKSRDYTIRYMKPFYYVLKKVSSETVEHKPMVGKKAYIPPTSYINEQGRIVDKIDYPFINDPKVIGTWKSVDFVREINQFKVDEQQWKGKLILNEMIFEKNGRLISKYDKVKRGTWTKGLVISNRNKTASRYHIKEIDGATYMFFEWKGRDYTIRHRKPEYYVLKKVSSETVPEPMVSEKAHIPPTSYINEEGRIVDKINYPFVNDLRIIGTWKSVDFVDEMEQFKVGEKQWRGELFLNEMIFEKNGRLISKYDKVKRGYPGTWTKGLVISNRNKTASRYHIKEIDGATYMFFEWKSRDYTIRHRKPAYCVLKKVSSQTGGLAKARASQPIDAEFARRLPAKIEQLDIDTADFERVIEIFGKPTQYVWGKETFTEDNLPKRYIMVYPSEFRVFMSNNKIIEIRHESGFSYVFRGKIRSGSTLDEVFEVIGQS